MSRKELYKNQKVDDEKLREKRRWEDSVLRKKNREKILNAKRIRRDDFEDSIEEDFTIEKVQNIASQLQHHSSNRLHLLKKLKKAFSCGGIFIDAFLNFNNAMQNLVGLLTGNDAQLQLEAAWCFTNIAAGTHDQSMKVLNAAGSYLITYLSSGNNHLQDQCAWAIGNLAGDSAEARETLNKQGVLQPLICLLRSSHEGVIQSSAFAMSNLLRGQEVDIRELLESDVISLLLTYLEYYKDQKHVLSEVAWVLAYLAVRLDNDEVLVNHGCLERIVSLLVILAEEQSHDSQVVTPLLRCLGNICSGPDYSSIQQTCQNTGLLTAIAKYLRSNHRHIRKETLWVVSNMTAGNVDICWTMMQAGLIPYIVEMLSLAYDIRQEAMYCICNFAFHGAEFCSHLLSLRVFQIFIQMLKSSDSHLLLLALKFVEMMLRTIPESGQKFEENDGVAFLEALEYHDNEEIQRQANQLLDTYFLQEKQPVDVEVDDIVSYPPWRVAAQKNISNQ